ncbi:MAG TPA: O-antigen ligase family protein [Candidatus Polarisedimenticolia bacterium]|nr:O-antigen ligase family protein [Candidatus Polarisedimenticolia bacterium]
MKAPVPAALRRGVEAAWRSDAPAASHRLFAGVLALLAILLGWLLANVPPLLALIAVGGALALTLWLLMPSLATYALVGIIPFTLGYAVGGVEGVSPRDALLVAMGVTAVATLASGSSRIERFRTVYTRRMMVLWLFLAVWGTVTFMLGPSNAWLLKDAVHNAWYVYGDLFRSILVFPLVLVCLDDGRSVERVVDILVTVAAGVSVNAILSAMESGDVAMAHFDHNNQLAGYLVLIAPLAAARLLNGSNRWVLALYSVSFALMLRALWLAGSRGGLVAFLSAMAVVVLFIPRRRLAVLGVLGLAGLATVVGLRGDLNLPMVSRFMAITDYKDVETFQWREEQWQIFLEKIAERPVLGWGSDVDESLKDLDRARTAHNAFLALCVKSGLPAAVAWVAILLLTAIAAVRGVLSPDRLEERWFWIGILAFLAAVVVNNLVESMLLTWFSQGIFWTLAACIALLHATEPPLRPPATQATRLAAASPA